MNTSDEHVRPRKEEKKNLLLHLLTLIVFVAFIAGGLIVSYDFFAPAPDIQP